MVISQMMPNQSHQPTMDIKLELGFLVFGQQNPSLARLDLYSANDHTGKIPSCIF